MLVEAIANPAIANESPKLISFKNPRVRPVVKHSRSKIARHASIFL